MSHEMQRGLSDRSTHKKTKNPISTQSEWDNPD